MYQGSNLSRTAQLSLSNDPSLIQNQLKLLKQKMNSRDTWQPAARHDIQEQEYSQQSPGFPKSDFDFYQRQQKYQGSQPTLSNQIDYRMMSYQQQQQLKQQYNPLQYPEQRISNQQKPEQPKIAPLKPQQGYSKNQYQNYEDPIIKRTYQQQTSLQSYDPYNNRISNGYPSQPTINDQRDQQPRRQHLEQQPQQVNLQKASSQPHPNEYAPRADPPPRQPIKKVNPIDELPAVAKKQSQHLIPEQDDNNIQECPEGCGRKFNAEALEKHISICQKVFQSKRKVFNSKAHRLVASEQLKLEKQGQVKDKIIEQKKKQGGDPKWKKQSEQFRAMISGMKNQEAPIEDDLVDCPSCGRRFSSDAADRHIPGCKKRNGRMK